METILEQRRYIKRKSDQLLGKTNMDFEQFCIAIDEAIHPDMMDWIDNMPVCKTRDSIKALAPWYHEKTGTSYYDIYLEQVVK